MRKNALVNGGGLGRHALGGKECLKTLRAELSGDPCGCGIFKRADKHLRQRGRIAGVGDKGMAGAERFDISTNIGRDDGEPDRHGFQHGQRQSFKFGRKNEKIGKRHEIGDIGSVTEKQDLRLEGRCLYQTLDRFQFFAPADQKEDSIRVGS